MTGLTADFFFVSDNNYVKNLGISSYSVLHNMCGEAEKVRIFVMDCGITEENKKRLINQTSRFDNAEIVFYDIDGKLNEIVPKVKNRWHRAIYGRLFLDEIVDKYSIDRIIYLDCDLLMDKPVTELLTMDLQGKCIAGVTDAADNERKKSLSLPQESNYINSGVLVIDTARWIELDASRRIIEFINSYPDELLYPDQDAINYVLGNDILILPPEYNLMWMLCHWDIAKLMRNIPDFFYTPEQIRYALYNPSILHFAGHDMWSPEGVTPVARRVFKKYRRLCDWRTEKLRFRSVGSAVFWLCLQIKRVLFGEYIAMKIYRKK